MTSDKARDEKTRVIGVRLTDDEIADLPPAESESARIRMALSTARELRPALETLPELATSVTALGEQNAQLAERLDAHCAALNARIETLSDGPDAFRRMAVEADARDVETSLCDVWAVCMEIWQQTLNNHLSITLIREALVDGDADPEALLAARIERLKRMQTDEFRDYRDRATWMLGVTDQWRRMRLDERAQQEPGAEGGPGQTASAAAE